MNPSWRRGLTAAALAGLSIFTIVELVRGAGSKPMQVLLALRQREVQRLAANSGYDIGDLWARARAIGARGVVLTPESADALWRRGEILRFTEAEAKKWPLAAASAVPVGNTLWTHDRHLLARLRASANARKFAVSTSSVGGLFVLRLPEGLDPRSLSAGFDPEALRWAMAGQWTAVLEGDVLEPWRALPAGRVVYVADPASEDMPFNVQFAFGHDARVAWPAAARVPVWDWAVGALQGLGLVSDSLTTSENPGALWRAVWGRGARVLVVPLRPEQGVEPNMNRLRLVADQLRAAGFEFGLPSPGTGGSWGITGALRCALAFLLAAFAPMFAVRQALSALRCVSCKTRWPQAFPVPELALGMLRAAAVSAGAGLACYALLCLPGWNLGPLSGFWDAWTFGVPLALSVLALYAEEVGKMKTWLDRSATHREALLAAIALGAMWLLVRPPRFPAQWLPASLWWLPLRWREVLVGYPCLLIGLCVHLYRLESKQPQAASAASSAKPKGIAALDPRPWLLFGVLAPIGALRAFGWVRMPPEMLLLHSAQALLLGASLGAVLLACRKLPVPSRALTAALLAMFLSRGAGATPDAAPENLFVNVEIDVSQHPDDLRDAVAGFSRTYGFSADPRFPPRFADSGRRRVELWGWLPGSRLTSAIAGADVKRVEVSRNPSLVRGRSVPPPGARTLNPQDPARVPEPSGLSGWAAENPGFLLLAGFLAVLSVVILRSPRKLSRITRRLLRRE